MKKFFLHVQSVIGLFILASFTMMACNNYGKKITIGKNEVYYKGDATQADAQKLGNYLKEGNKYFDDNTAFAVQVEQQNGNYITRLVIDREKIKSAADLNDEQYNFVAGEISKNVFDGKPITVEVTDEYFKPIKTYTSKQS